MRCAAHETAEAIRKRILLIAEEVGDTVIHSWTHDLQDGSFNVAAIIETNGKFTTVGWNIR